jgi:CspA family cold shock protein
MPQGKIKKLVADKGFGFIETDGDDMFFHRTGLQGMSIKDLSEGQTVEYEVGEGRKGPCATNIRVVE